MGCNPSKHNDERTLETRECDHDADRITAMVMFPQSKVDVVVGNGILREVGIMQTVIFIFGGPGSQKGILTQELAHEYDFTLIDVEDIVFSYLPGKVANTVSGVVEIQEILRRDSGVLTVEWILNMINAKLTTSSNQRFIIDIVPELSSIIKSKAYQTQDHEAVMKNFERRHYIQFAIELIVPDDEPVDYKDDDNHNGVNTKQLSPELTAFVKGIDEADKGRLEKRIANYNKCAKPFLEYFHKTKRVVRFDCKCSRNPNAVIAVREIFNDFGFARNNDFIQVVVFFPRDNFAESIDLKYYRLKKVYLSDICPNQEETLSRQIRGVRKFIYQTARCNENFLVILNGLNNTDYPLTKRINFVETKNTYLDYYIRQREAGSPSVRCKMPFRSISTTTSEVCLFPKSMSEKLCHKIGFIFGEKLTFKESNSRKPSSLNFMPNPSNSSDSYHAK